MILKARNYLNKKIWSLYIIHLYTLTLRIVIIFGPQISKLSETTNTVLAWYHSYSRIFCDKLWCIFISMVECKTAVFPLLTHRRYCSIAPNHRYDLRRANCFTYHKKHYSLNYYTVPMHLVFSITSCYGSSVRHAFSAPVPLVCHFLYCSMNKWIYHIYKLTSQFGISCPHCHTGNWFVLIREQFI